MTRKHEDEPARQTKQSSRNTLHADEATSATAPSSPATAAPDQLWKYAPLRLKADYKEVPGSGKNRVNLRGQDDGLWVDLGVQSLVPDLDESSSSAGLVAGAGAQLIDTFSAPMTKGPSSHGTGKVTAHLHHATRLDSSLSITVKLQNQRAPATVTRKAVAFIKQAATKLGDVEQLEARATEYLASNGIYDAKVEITRNTKATHDVGETSFHYRMRGPAQILLDIQPADAGQSEPTKYEKTKGEGATSSREGERHHEASAEDTMVIDAKRASEEHREHSEETSEMQYNKRVVETLDDIVSEVEDMRKDFVKHVTNDLTTHNKFNELKKIDKDWDERSTRRSGSKATSHKKSRDEDNRNLANGVNDITSTIKDAFTIPYLKDLKFVRRLQPWWLLVEGIDVISGRFKAKGTVHVEDSNENTSGHESENKNGRSHERQDSRGNKTETVNEQNRVKEVVEEGSRSLWANFKHRVETTSESFRSRNTKRSGGGSEKSERTDHVSSNRKESAGASERAIDEKHSTSTVKISASDVTKFTKPTVRPTVVAGDCDVSTEPFGVERKKDE